MKKATILFSMFLFASVAFAGGVMETTSFYSDALGEVRELNVYLPEGYDPHGDTLYPVVYFLHGYTSDHFFYFPYLLDNMDNMIASKTIDPTILVMPNGCTASGLGSQGAWYVNSELFGDYEDFIVYDLVEFIDTNYRSFPSREKRSISGHSMGGFGCMQLALKHPEIYRGVASFSGMIGHWSYIDPYYIYALIMEADPNGYGPPYNFDPSNGWNTNAIFVCCGALSPNLNNPPHYVDFLLDPYANLVPSVVAKWDLVNPPNLAQFLPQYPALSIYFDCGDQDEYFAHLGNADYTLTLDSLGIPHEYHSFEGDHLSMLGERVPIGMTFLDKAMHQKGWCSGPVIYVESQDLYYDSIILWDPMPPFGKFQEIEMGGPHGGLQVEYGPWSKGYRWGKMKEDFDNDGNYHYFWCPLLGKGRPDPWN